MFILFYGNCQLDAISKTLNLSCNYNKFTVLCYDTVINKEDFTDIIIKCDVIITQNIHNNYRKLEYLSTAYINKHKKLDCKLIIVDSCYFKFYYFDIIDIDYSKMVEYYNNGKPTQHYINNYINNLDLKSSEELEKIADDSLNELYIRYINCKATYNDNNIIYNITTYEYIKQNYKNILLFYTSNHPAKYVIQFICEKIVDFLQIQNTINYTIDVLNTEKWVLYTCIKKIVNFDIDINNMSRSS